jgi:formylglycine-generating enzyme required for sulfatase activity
MRKRFEPGIRIELHFLIQCLDRLGEDHGAGQAARTAAAAVLQGIGAGTPVAEHFRTVPRHGEALWAQVRGGGFQMGSPEGEEGRLEDEKQVEVRLSSFWIARVPVTVAQYRLFDPEKRRRWGEDPDLPMNEVSWHEAALFCRWLEHHGGALKAELGRAAGLDLRSWRFELPTEARWEYACRDGGKSTTRFVNGDSERDLARVAVYGKGFEGGPEPVGSKEPSAHLRLWDMHGNVWEWCSDWYAAELRGGDDPAGPAAGAWRVLRGGSFWFVAWHCRSAYRYGVGPDFDRGDDAFRAVLAPPPPER